MERLPERAGRREQAPCTFGVASSAGDVGEALEASRDPAIVIELTAQPEALDDQRRPPVVVTLVDRQEAQVVQAPGDSVRVTELSAQRQTFLKRALRVRDISLR